MKTPALLAATLAAALAFAHGSAVAGDAESGEKVFKKCKACHDIKAGKHKVGPSLHGIVGRQAGTADGYKKYKGLKDVEFVWDEALLDAYLTNPKGFVLEHTDNKRSSMTFKLKKEDQRADVIEYLKTIK